MVKLDERGCYWPLKCEMKLREISLLVV